ncbi:MAG: hypothetical protein KJ886_02610, partial [Candidatus Thermoplasmatota archaeon]|nr:hypothetical protein [Candidatus Thermoplasmatota archaeon]
IPYLSLNTAVLASYRKAIVVTGDYTIEQSWTMQLGYGTGDAGSGERGEDTDTLTDDDEIVLQKNINTKAIKLDNDIDYAANFLKNHEMSPEYLALVGGPVSLPMLYIKNPIWYEDANNGDNGEEYLASDSYYADLDIKLTLDKNTEGEYICYNPDKENAAGEYNGSNYEMENDLLYTQELAVGRVVASNLLDTSALLVRGFLYSDTPDTASIVTSKVCGTASFPYNPVGPPRDQQRVFLQNGITAKVWSPTETSVSQKIPEDPAFMSKAYFIIYDGHGYPDGWYYWWMSHHDDEKNTERIGTEDVRELDMKPSIIFSASCLCSALDWPVIWKDADNQKNGTPDTFFSLGVIHAGAIAHIGSTEESWGAFLGGAVSGYGDFDLATIYFEELLNNDLSIGMAHSTAKQKYYSDYNSVFDKTCFLENVLYGEPAVNP